MLNIVAVDCNGVEVKYRYYSIREFVDIMCNGDDESLPIPDATIIKLDTNDKDVQKWWETAKNKTIDDLFVEFINR